MAVWSENVLSRLLGLVVLHYTLGAELDGDRSVWDGPQLELAEALANAAAPQGLSFPDTDRALGALLARDATAASIDVRGAVGQLPDGRLAVAAGWGRTVESAGEGLALIETPNPARYTRFWLLPGATYLGRKN
ncbi:hypothetical protein ACMX2H_17480 [Arthrobacter sulfonylureivorans]|uniref:hypothetical protein n=1 Tax=Arthrobacter sulfonylureivorans TaxID=2486855 RepID=UPI0039E40A20